MAHRGEATCLTVMRPRVTQAWSQVSSYEWKHVSTSNDSHVSYYGVAMCQPGIGNTCQTLRLTRVGQRRCHVCGSCTKCVWCEWHVRPCDITSSLVMARGGWHVGFKCHMSWHISTHGHMVVLHQNSDDMAMCHVSMVMTCCGATSAQCHVMATSTQWQVAVTSAMMLFLCNWWC